ncbi:hypothetical protein DFH09DRAFT_1084790 [Mycena vulgaris]|nr:hypothetical protein DFH09DRAFT_1084790 [Mycena vulgaris]
MHTSTSTSRSSSSWAPYPSLSALRLIRSLHPQPHSRDNDNTRRHNVNDPLPLEPRPAATTTHCGSLPPSPRTSALPQDRGCGHRAPCAAEPWLQCECEGPLSARATERRSGRATKRRRGYEETKGCRGSGSGVRRREIGREGRIEDQGALAARTVSYAVSLPSSTCHASALTPAVRSGGEAARSQWRGMGTRGAGREGRVKGRPSVSSQREGARGRTKELAAHAVEDYFYVSARPPVPATLEHLWHSVRPSFAAALFHINVFPSGKFPMYLFTARVARRRTKNKWYHR